MVEETNRCFKLRLKLFGMSWFAHPTEFRPEFDLLNTFCEHVSSESKTCQIWISEVWRYHSSSSSAQDVKPKKFDWSTDPNIPRNGCSRLLTCPTVVSFPLSRKMVFASPPPPTTRPGDWSTWGVALGFGSFCCYCWANKQTTDELVSKPRVFLDTI